MLKSSLCDHSDAYIYVKVKYRRNTGANTGEGEMKQLDMQMKEIKV